MQLRPLSRDHFKPGATTARSTPLFLPRSIRFAARYGVPWHPGKKEARLACDTVSPRFEMVSYQASSKMQVADSADLWYRLARNPTMCNRERWACQNV